MIHETIIKTTDIRTTCYEYRSQSSYCANLPRNLRNAFTLKVQGTYLLRILQAIINDSTYLAQKNHSE